MKSLLILFVLLTTGCTKTEVVYEFIIQDRSDFVRAFHNVPSFKEALTAKGAKKERETILKVLEKPFDEIIFMNDGMESYYYVWNEYTESADGFVFFDNAMMAWNLRETKHVTTLPK